MKQYIFYFSLFFILILGFFLLVPKVSTRIFPFARNKMLSDFIQSSRKNKSINAREFWILREFYSPGSFIFEEKGLSKPEADSSIKMLKISLNKKSYIYPFLIFNSDRFNSIEALTNDNNLSRVIQNLKDLKGKNCIIEQKSEFICNTDEHTIFIVFIKPMNEMQKTNGFFDYKRQDLAELTKGKYWLVISRIVI